MLVLVPAKAAPGAQAPGGQQDHEDAHEDVGHGRRKDEDVDLQGRYETYTPTVGSTLEGFKVIAAQAMDEEGAQPMAPLPWCAPQRTRLVQGSDGDQLRLALAALFGVQRHNACAWLCGPRVGTQAL